jgi:iron complex outermembrane recepter protein
VIKKTCLTVAAVLAMAAFSAPVFAQLEEVVVTATKREQTLQDIPVAVTVTKGVVLERAQIQDIIDLQSVVPSLHVEQEQTSSNTNFLIRGFGNGANNPGIEPSVGLFVDGVYRSRSAAQIGDMVDVERVEVLRGPQSTLFGQNASAGVISIVSKLPSFTFGGDVEAGFGNYSEKLLKARLTGPISDTLAFSLAGTYNERDGYFKDLATGGKVNDRKRWDVHGQLLYKPSSTLTVRLLADVSNIDEICCSVVNLFNGDTGAIIQAVGGKIYTGSPFDRKAYYNIDPANNIDNNGLSLHVDWDLEAARLTSITAYRSQKAKFSFDVDFTSADIAKQITDQRIHTFTQEIRLASNKDGALNWMVGGYYFDETVKYSNTIVEGADIRNYTTGIVVGAGGSPFTYPGLETALGLPVGTFFGNGQALGIDADQKGKALTFFGQLDWKLVDKVKLTAGLAHTTSKKDVTLGQRDSDVFSALNFVNIGFAGAFSALTGGLPPTPANLSTHPVQAGTADFLSVTPCSAAHPPPGCNQLLGLYGLQFLPPVVPYSDSSNDGQTTYTARLSWNLADNVNVYGGVSTGFKATSWNLSINSLPLPPATPDRSPLGGFVNPYYGRYGTRFARPEKSTVYEIGLKGQWPTLALNVALFDESIKNFQSNLFTGTGFNLANAGKQSTKGVEVEAQWKPNQSWEFSLAGTFMDPKYDSYVGASCVSPATNNICDLSGKTPSDIHKQSITSAVTYLWRYNSLNGYIRLDHLYADKIQLIDNVPESVATQAISTLNASTGIAINGWDVSLWCRNLNNDNYLVLAFPVPAQSNLGPNVSNSYAGYTNQPRTYGLTVRKSF